MTRSTGDRIASLLFSSQFADVILAIPSKDKTYKERIFAHRFILRLHSIVFETMLSPVSQRQIEELEMPDETSDGLKVMLRFMYSNEINLTIENVHSTMYVAQKYFLNELAGACVQFMQQNLRPETVINILKDADTYHIDDLKEACMKVIDYQFPFLSQRNEFSSLSRDLMAAIIKRDSLKCRENDIYLAVFSWYRKNSDESELNPIRMRKDISDVIDHIRFPLMSTIELFKGPCKTGMLDAKEAFQVSMYIYDEDEPHPRFSSKPRDTYK